MYDINYELIGSIPAVEYLRDVKIDSIRESALPVHIRPFGRDGAIRCMAAHFYGIETDAKSTDEIRELMSAIQANIEAK